MGMIEEKGDQGNRNRVLVGLPERLANAQRAVRDLERENERLTGERDEMRRANVTPEDRERPLGQSVEYWQDRCLDHAAALDESRIRVRELERENEQLRRKIGQLRRRLQYLTDNAHPMDFDSPAYD